MRLYFILLLGILFFNCACGPGTGTARIEPQKQTAKLKASPSSHDEDEQREQRETRVAQVEEQPQPEESFQEVENISTEILLPKDHQFTQADELDLHGKRVKRAKELVSTFLEESFNAGKDAVLIITGKGLHSKESKKLADGTEVGLIKYNFLDWLHGGIFNKFIRHASYAHGAHGGEGAFYISLKHK